MSTPLRAKIACRQLACCLAMALWASQMAAAQAPAPQRPLDKLDKLRLVYVPQDELSVVLGDGIERVLIDREEAMALLARPPAVEVTPPPREYVWQSATYEAQLEDGTAVVTAVFVGDVLARQPISVQVPWTSGAIRSIAVNGEAPTLFWNRGAGGRRQLECLFTESGRMEWTMTWALPVEVDAARQTVRWEFPPIPAAQWTLRIDGNIDVVAGATTKQRTYSAADDRTTLELLPQVGRVDLVLSLNNRMLADQLVWDDHQVSVAHLGAAEDLVDCYLLPRVVHGTLTRGEWQIDARWDVLDVTGEHVREWGLSSDGAEVTLWVEFQSPVTGSEASVQVRALSHRADPGESGEWQLPTWRAVGADRSTQLTVITLPQGWSAHDIEAPQHFAVDLSDVEGVLATLPPAVHSDLPRADMAFYSPQRGAAITVRARRAPSRSSVVGSVLFSFDDHQAHCLADFRMALRGAEQFEVEVDVPGEFHVHDVCDVDHTLAFHVVEKSAEKQRLVIRLRDPLQPNRPAHFMVRASAPLHHRAAAHRFETFVPAVVGADETSGVVAVVVGGELTLAGVDGGESVPVARQDLTQFDLQTLNPHAAFEFFQPAQRLAIDLERRAPRVAGQIVTYYRIEPTRAIVHAELLLDIQQASLQQFTLLLPPDAPQTVQVTTGGGQRVAEMMLRPADEGVACDIQLASRALGPTALFVDYELTVPDNPSFTREVRPVRLAGDGLVTNLVCLEGHPQLDVTPSVEIGADSLDLLPATSYAPGRHVIGVVEARDEGRALPIQVVRRVADPPPSIIVEHCALRSSITRHGLCQTWVEYRLKATHPQMHVRLPVSAALWTLSLDGRPQRGQRIGDDLLVTFPRGSAHQSTSVQLMYESTLHRIGWSSELELQAPELFVAGDVAGTLELVPIVGATWEVSLPQGYTVRDCRNGWHMDAVDPYQTWDVRLRGGIEFAGRALAPAVEFRASESAMSRDEVAPGQALSVGGGVAEERPAGGELNLDAPQTVEPPPPPERSQAPPGASGAWSDHGYRGIDIQSDQSSPGVAFTATGNRSSLVIGVANERGAQALGWGLCLLAFAIGCGLWKASWRARSAWVIALLAVALAGTWLGVRVMAADTVADKLVWAALALVVVYLATSLIAWVGRLVSGLARGRAARMAGTAVVVIGATWMVAASAPQDQPGQGLAAGPGRLDDRAIVIPFDPLADPRDEPRGWLFPKAWYERLLADREPDAPRDLMAGREFVWSRALYRASSDEHAFLVQAELDIDLPGPDPVFLPIAADGGAIVLATLDDLPAVLSTEGEPQVSPSKRGFQQPRSLGAAIRVTGTGRHTARVQWQFPLEKIAGGYRVKGQLPQVLAAHFQFQGVPGQVVRWQSSGWKQEHTVGEGGEAALNLSENGDFQLEWRDAAGAPAAVGSANWSLDTAVSVFTQSLQASANLVVQFGESSDHLRLSVPADVRIDEISGDNIRGWARNDDDRQQVDIWLLSPAPAATVSVRYSSEFAPMTHEGAVLRVPLCDVSGRGAAVGKVHIWRSPLIQLTAEPGGGLRRIDWAQAESNASPHTSRQPLAALPFQSFEFVRSGADLQLRASLIAVSVQAQHRTVFHLGLTRCRIESRIDLEIEGALRELELAWPQPLEFGDNDLRVIDAASKNEVAHRLVKEEIGEQTRVRLRFDRQVTRPLAIVMRTQIDLRKLNQIDWRPMRVLQAAGETYEYAAVADPALHIDVAEAEGLRRILVGALGTWFDRGLSPQTPWAARAESSAHGLTLTWRRLAPRIRFESITDVAFTRQSIEETILLEWQIEQSGIEVVEFLVPRAVQNAVITGPWISRVERKPVDSEWTQFTVHLQDRVLGEFRLALQHDAPLGPTWSASLPVNLTGESMQRLVTVQNSGRDELAFEPTAGVEQIVRERALFRMVQQKLNAPFLATAYSARADDRRAGLTLRTVPREIVQTVAAAIPFCETEVMIDQGGGYVARQTMRVNNRTEPVLDLLLPEGGRLVSLSVDRAVALPLSPAGDRRRVRVPLLKSTEGELDYPIVVLYCGQLAAASSEWEIPLAHTVNIETQVSHVRLYLNAAIRPLWFGGTLTQVDSEGRLIDDYIDYQSRQLIELKTRLGKRVPPSGSRGVRLGRGEELQREFQQHAQGQVGGQQLLEMEKLQQELHEIQQLDADLTAVQQEIGNANRLNIADLVDKQSIRNEFADEQGLAYNFSEYFDSSSLESRAQFGRRFSDSVTGRADEGGAATLNVPGHSSPRGPLDRAETLNQRGFLPQGAAAREGQVAPNNVDTPQVVGGVTVEFTPRGEAYFFRAPRGKPQLTLRAVTETTVKRAFSTVQLAGAILVILVAAVIAKAFSRRSANRAA